MTSGNSKKRVLIFSQAYYPNYIGGAEVAVQEITKRLEGNFDFDLITLKRGESRSEYVENVHVYRVGPDFLGNGFMRRTKIYKYLFPFFAFLKARQLNRQKKYDMTWAIMASYSGFAALIFKIFNPKIPYILTLQEGDPISKIKRQVFLVYPIFRMIFTRADKIQAISNFLADFGKSMGHKKEISIVPNGVDLEVFGKEVSEEVKSKMRNQLGKKEDEAYLVTTSRLVHKNATDDIISALPKLPQNISLIIIGKGEEGLTLQKQADSLGVGNRVKFVGFVEYYNIPKYFSVCDIFIRPSRSEGFGNSFIEAMASGLPVIATPVGGIVDFLDDKETGVFCAPDNPQSIVQSVNLILNDSHLRNHIIKKAHERVLERYSWEKVSLEMKEVFDKVS